MIFVERIFVLLIIYSFIGWVYESTLCSITQKKLVNRGFLNGPICPIYGVGIILVVLCLDSFKNNIVLLFLGSIVITSILEYVVSYVLEKLFKTKWWDYSNFRFNINGRVWIVGSIIFGILTVLVIRFIHPFFSELVNRLSNSTLLLTSSVLFLIFLFDLFVTVSHLVNFNKILCEIAEAFNKYTEQSKQTSPHLKSIGVETLESNKNYFDQIPQLAHIKRKQFVRLTHAFPKMNSLQHMETFNQIKEFFVIEKDRCAIVKQKKRNKNTNGK